MTQLTDYTTTLKGKYRNIICPRCASILETWESEQWETFERPTKYLFIVTAYKKHLIRGECV